MIDNKILSFLPKVYFPKIIFFGEKGLFFLKSIEDKKVFFVFSSEFKEKNEEYIFNLFKEKIKFFVQNREPREEDFEKLKKICKENNFDYLIAFGGGSVIDLAKLVKKDLNIKMVAIPTTIGSGSEVSQHSILISSKEKKVFSSPYLLPEIIILNPKYLKSLSKEQIIFQSIDALSHGLESLVSRMSNLFTENLSLISIENIYCNLSKLAKKEVEDKILEELQISSFLSGLAQSSAGTGLVHSFAHYFGPKNNLSHAESISIFLLDILKYNSEKVDKYEKLDKLKNLSSKNFIISLGNLFKELKIERKKIKISGNLKEIANLIKKDICTITNPCSPTEEDIIKILKKHI